MVHGGILPTDAVRHTEVRANLKIDITATGSVLFFALEIKWREEDIVSVEAGSARVVDVENSVQMVTFVLENHCCETDDSFSRVTQRKILFRRK